MSKRLMGAWAFFDFCLLAAGAITVGVSVAWKAPDLLMNFVISSKDLFAGVVLGVAFLLTWAVSIGAIIQPLHVTLGLVILNWILLVDALAVIVVGTTLWFYTLQERMNYHEVYAAVSAQTRLSIQDKMQCCGYFNTTDLVEIGGFCADQTFVDTTVNSTGAFCVGPITNFADMTMNNIFSTVYGFMAILICLFLASLCVINKRIEEQRFRKIDEKRGGRGFV